MHHAVIRCNYIDRDGERVENGILVEAEDGRILSFVDEDTLAPGDLTNRETLAEFESEAL